MDILKTPNDVKKWRNKIDGSLGFAPTMGALHDGHLKLFKESLKHNKKTLVSIFVNPAQFGANEDFSKYPRNIDGDIKFCKKAGVDAVFVPEAEGIYGELDFSILPPNALCSVFEGAIRPSHFAGVCLVVLKFFNLIRPTNAYFGKKDAQQLLIIQKMAAALFLDVKINPIEIMRDKNNLALSSRNAYLNKDSYKRALALPRAIGRVQNAFENGIQYSTELIRIAKSELDGLKIDYCEIIDFNLKKIASAKEKKSLMIIAINIDGVRLLDNFWF